MEIEDPAGPGCRDSPGAAQAAEGQQKRENKEKGNEKMKKMNNKRGFTLAELLIVVANIAVLVAISIPIFTSQLEKSREATDAANLRAAYAEISAELLTWDGSSTIASKTVTAVQTQANWQSQANATQYDNIGGIKVDTANKGGTNTKWTIAADTTNNKVTITAEK